MSVEGLSVGIRPFLVLVDLASDVVDIGRLLGYVLFDLFEGERLAVLSLKKHCSLRLCEVELYPCDLVIEDPRVLHKMEGLVQPTSDLNDPLGVSHQDQSLELFCLATLVIILEPREE